MNKAVCAIVVHTPLSKVASCTRSLRLILGVCILHSLHEITRRAAGVSVGGLLARAPYFGLTIALLRRVYRLRECRRRSREAAARHRIEGALVVAEVQMKTVGLVARVGRIVLGHLDGPLTIAWIEW